uniref:Putative secreted protein n=1 Tax=Anopheles triannulatus TaxID=58253 RepID=A0A2M4B6D0_9DIPT
MRYPFLFLFFCCCWLLPLLILRSQSLIVFQTERAAKYKTNLASVGKQFPNALTPPSIYIRSAPVVPGMVDSCRSRTVSWNSTEGWLPVEPKN